MRTALILLSVLVAACTGDGGGDTGGADTAAGDTLAARGTADAAAGGRVADDRGPRPAGLPAGYLASVDRASDSLSRVRYVAGGEDERWEVTTGPAHVVWSPRDTASGRYTVEASLDILGASEHPEAFGIFFGGENLRTPGQQRYAYFLVRRTGEYLVKVREGEGTRNVVNWTRSDAIPHADEHGRAQYRLAAQVSGDSVRLLVNGRPVTSVAASAVPTSGIAGLRINHHLRLAVTPVTVSRR